jgi:hypothetical protein
MHVCRGNVHIRSAMKIMGKSQQIVISISVPRNLSLCVDRACDTDAIRASCMQTHKQVAGRAIFAPIIIFVTGPIHLSANRIKNK